MLKAKEGQKKRDAKPRIKNTVKIKNIHLYKHHLRQKLSLSVVSEKLTLNTVGLKGRDISDLPDGSEILHCWKHWNCEAKN